MRAPAWEGRSFARHGAEDAATPEERPILPVEADDEERGGTWTASARSANRSTRRTVLVAFAAAALLAWACILNGRFGHRRPTSTAGIVGFTQDVAEGTRLTVLKTAAIFQGTSQWTPLRALEVGAKVTASGPPLMSHGIEMLPINEVTDLDGATEAVVGAVQMRVLKLPVSVFAPAGNRSLILPDAWAPSPVPSPLATHTSPLFDCNAGFANWQLEWSKEKQNWCCKSKLRGCGAATHDCTKDSQTWRTTWPNEKKRWCCANTGMGCSLPSPSPTPITTSRSKPKETTTSTVLLTRVPDDGTTFDCNAGYSTWVSGWSHEKMDWCCAKVGRACSAPGPLDPGTEENGPMTYTVTELSTTTEIAETTRTYTTTAFTTPLSFDCSYQYDIWERAWSDWKKRWCCTTEKRGCPDGKQLTGTCFIRNLFYKKLQEPPAGPRINTAVNFAIKDALKELACPSDTVLVARKMQDCELVTTLEQWEGGHQELVTRFKVLPSDTFPMYQLHDRIRANTLPPVVRNRIERVQHINTVSKAPINVTCLVDLFIVKVQCACPNGTPKTGTACPGSGGLLCQSCNFGFKLVGPACKPKVCVCENGIPAEEAACPVDGQPVCGFCHQGFHIEHGDNGQVLCKPNVCKCLDGTPATGAHCANHRANICLSCNPGYHVDARTYQCMTNKCTCLNGVWPEEGSPNCTVDQGHLCVGCNKFYHLEQKKCRRNECRCHRGTAALGEGPPGCFEHQANVCVDCHDGLELSATDHTCGEKKCVCQNGVPAKSPACTSAGGNMCSQCNPGYGLIDKQCVKDACVCHNGEPVVGTFCNANGGHMCKTCHDGHHIVHEGPNTTKCLRNICQCDHGDKAIGEKCLQDGLEVCDRCYPGFHQSLANHKETQRVIVRCKHNVCKCTHGEAATVFTDPQCSHDGTEACVSCKPGFHLGADYICRMRHCTCEHGIGKVGEDCPSHDEEDCHSCEVGYKLIPDPFVAGATICQKEKPESFNCDADKGQGLLGWSLLKMEWCCQEKNVGCDVLRQTAEQACTGKDWSETECKAIACCRFEASSNTCASNKPAGVSCFAKSNATNATQQ